MNYLKSVFRSVPMYMRYHFFTICAFIVATSVVWVFFAAVNYLVTVVTGTLAAAGIGVNEAMIVMALMLAAWGFVMYAVVFMTIRRLFEDD